MMIRIYTLFTLLYLALPIFSQSAQKTFSKSFNADDAGRIRLEVPGNVDLKVWNNPTIRVEISVHLPSGNTSLLNELANVGRYNLTAALKDGVLSIDAPNLQKVIRIKGEELREDVRFTVFIPKGLEVEMPNPGIVAGAQPQNAQNKGRRSDGNRYRQDFCAGFLYLDQTG